MAYSTSNPPSLVAQRVGASSGALWIYSDGDPIATITGANYISNGDALGMEAGDSVVVVNATNHATYYATVSAVTAGGAATLVVNEVQELTVTGAVTPGVRQVELNHASTIIAATIADASDHAGLFIVKDTSASGTAAHTLTLTSGTFDGTNNVATLNAPAELLIVFFDDDGNGTIVQNTGSVALS
jgi:hypothetical protein